MVNFGLLAAVIVSLVWGYVNSFVVGRFDDVYNDVNNDAK